MFKRVTTFVGLLALIHPIAAQPSPSVESSAVETKATPAAATAPSPPVRVSPPPAPPVVRVDPGTDTARRLAEEKEASKQQLNRDFLDACRHFNKTKIEALLLQGWACSQAVMLRCHRECIYQV